MAQRITKELLKKHHVDPYLCDTFEEKWPAGAEVDEEVITWIVKEYEDAVWVIQKFYPSLLPEYNSQATLLDEEYRHQVAALDEAMIHKEILLACRLIKEIP